MIYISGRCLPLLILDVFFLEIDVSNGRSANAGERNLNSNILEMPLKLFQGRILVTVVVADAFDVDVGDIGGHLLVRSDYICRVDNGDVPHDKRKTEGILDVSLIELNCWGL